jgi:hypothetical protein
MDIMVRDVDRTAFRHLKALAALEGKSLGEVVSQALRSHVAQNPPFPKDGSLRDIQPMKFRRGNERLSEEIDAVVYGV